MINKAIILSAGSGKRMGTAIAKQYLPLKDKPIIYYTIKAFEESFIDEIILVCGLEDMEYCRKEIVDKYNFSKVTKIVPGGSERYYSVLNGIKAAGKCDYLYIQDGARPFVTADILERTREALKTHSSCVVGMPVKDTIKIVDENNIVTSTPNRSSLCMIQTPQAFAYPVIKEAYEAFEHKGEALKEQGVVFTDDAMMVECFMGEHIKIVEGSYDNIKITTSEDMIIGEKILENRGF